MGDFKTLLANLDDDYLVGMANKGIVKRAYKDMEAGDYKVLSVDGDAQVTVGGSAVSTTSFAPLSIIPLAARYILSYPPPSYKSETSTTMVRYGKSISFSQ